MVRVITPFRDRETWRAYAAGDEYGGTPERIRELARGGYVESGLVAQGGQENALDGGSGAQAGSLDGLTVDELRRLAEERGVELPKRARKSELIDILGG